MLESNLPFEDELEDEDYYPSLPFAALFSCLKVPVFFSFAFFQSYLMNLVFLWLTL